VKEVPGGERYSFDHGVIREVLYDSMGRNLRRMIHRKVAQVLERVYSSDIEPVVYDLARHYGNTKDHEKALLYCVKAARRAMRLFALKEARDYFNDAIGQLGEVKDLSSLGLGTKNSVEVALLNEAASASWHVGDTDQAKRYATRALDLAQTEGLYHEMAHAYVLRGTISDIKGEKEEAVMDLEAGVELSEKIGDQKGRLEAIQMLGKVHWSLGNYEKALEYLNDCVRGAEKIGEQPLLSMALITKGNVYNVRGDWEEAAKLYERGLRIAKESNATYELMRAYNNLGDMYLDRNELESAEGYFKKCQEAAERTGDIRMLGYALTNLCETFIKRGDFIKARTFGSRALEMFTRLDEKAMIAAVYDDFGVIHTHDNNWTEAAVCFDLSIGVLETLKQPHTLAKAHFDYGMMFKNKGDRVGATSQFEAAKAIYTRVGAANFLKEVDKELSSLRTGVEPTKVDMVGRDGLLKGLSYLLEVGSGLVSHSTAMAPQGVEPVKGSGLFVLLEGEQGMGKSRIVEEVAIDARKRGITTLTGRCLRSESSNPYYPFIQALTELFKGKDQASLHKFMRRAPLEVLSVLPGIGAVGLSGEVKIPITTDAFDGKGADLGAMKDRMFEVLSRLLLEFEEPVALILEDLHCADVSSMQVLAYIAREMAGSKTFILASYSPDAILGGSSFLDNLEALTKEPTVRSLKVESLDASMVKDLISRFLRVSEVPDAFAHKVHQRTRGNPMFVEELLKVLPKGMTAEDMVKFDLEKVQVPDNVTELIGKQLSRLSPEERELLEYASVAGSTFSTKMLFETMGLGKYDEGAKEVKDILGNLVNLRYMRFLDENRLSFVHPMVQQVVYEAIPLDRRRNMHKAFGRSWERLGRDDPERVAFDLAYHFSRGGADDKAFRYLMLAGQRAETMSAPRESETFFKEALRCADMMRMKRGEESTISVGEVLMARHHLDQAFIAQGKLDEAMEVSRITLSVARDVSDLNREAQALMDIGEIASIRSSWDEARSTFDRARVLCTDTGFKRGLFRAYKGLSWISWRRGEFERAFVYANECVKLANELEDKHLLAQAYMEIAGAHGEKGDFEEAIEIASKARAIFEAAGDKTALARVHNNLGVAYREKGDPLEAMTHFERSIAISREIGGTRMTGYAMTNLSECHMLIGNLTKAAEICQKALAIFLKLDEPFMVSSCYRRLGMIDRKQQKYDSAEAHILKSISIIKGLETPAHHAEAHYELGLLYIDTGKADKAKEELKMAVDIFNKLGMKHGQDKTLKVLSELVKLMEKGTLAGVGPGNQDQGQ
jgi:predicted ATPase